jgi:hypothetical protein
MGTLGILGSKKNEILRLMGIPQCLIFGKCSDVKWVVFFLGFAEELTSKR